MTDVEVAVAAVQAEVERRRDDLVALTRDLVRIPSVNPKFQAASSLNREADVQALLDPLLREDGFLTERIEVFPGRPNLLAERPGSEGRSLILCGHVDVVPAGERSR